jgi:hypothetical protein
VKDNAAFSRGRRLEGNWFHGLAATDQYDRGTLKVAGHTLCLSAGEFPRSYDRFFLMRHFSSQS